MSDASDARTAVVVTTDHQDVFFGYVPADTELTERTLRLEDCRMCVWWPTEQHGAVGLAADGPSDGSRITAAAPAMTLHGVTSVMECSDRAVERWEDEPWN